MHKKFSVQVRFSEQVTCPNELHYFGTASTLKNISISSPSFMLLISNHLVDFILEP